MLDVGWDDQDENIFGAIIRIAHYTGFAKSEILNWTIDEVNKALKIIKNEEQKQSLLLFAVADYSRLIELEPSNKDGTSNKSERAKLMNKAQKIRSIFTGEEVEKEESNNIKFFSIRSERVVEEMTVEEYKKYKKENNGS